MEAFGIFEGGGAKGLGHVAALRVAKQYRIELRGVAGASAGAIAAALAAVRYQAEDLYRPPEAARGAADGLLERPFTAFLDPDLWRKWQALKGDAVEALKDDGANWFTKAKRIGELCWTHRDLLKSVIRDRGIFSTNAFEEWLNTKLRARVALPNGRERVLFSDLGNDCLPLKVIATDITKKAIAVFSKETTPNLGVAEAVGASMAIPFFFKPKELPLGADAPPSICVDGGVLSNFPAWVFDEERRQRGPLTTTLGFRLIGKGDEANKTVEPGLMRYIARFFTTVLEGDERLEIREIENMHVVPLYVPASTLALDLTAEERLSTYRSALSCCHDFFAALIGTCSPQLMEGALAGCHSMMLHAIGRHAHLRVNVILPTARSTLRVSYSHNMEKDADDRLEFPIGSGAAGECWVNKEPVVCDLLEAKSSFEDQWKLDKYQQAWVRPQLKSLLCVPIFDPDKYQPGQPLADVPLLGVLDFDSDDIATTEFSGNGVRTLAERKLAPLVAQVLKQHAGG